MSPLHWWGYRDENGELRLKLYFRPYGVPTDQVVYGPFEAKNSVEAILKLKGLAEDKFPL